MIVEDGEIGFFFSKFMYIMGPTKIPLVKGTAHGNKKPFGTKIKVLALILCSAMN